MRIFVQFLGVLSVAIIISCVSSSIRLPASFKPKYNSQIVTSLKSAALNGVLFQVNDSVFRDVPSRHIENCRKAEAPTWSEEFLSLLALLDKNPQYYEKFHIVDFKRGDRARVELTKDIDGLSYLNLTYAKREIREKIGPATPMPCGESVSEYLGKDLATILIDWPSPEEISQALRQAPVKSSVARFHFNTDFLIFLAERQTILKINPEVAFERTFQGEYFLGQWLEKMAQDLRLKDVEYEFINYWLKEISTHSEQARTIQFFGLHPESTLAYGLQVDTVGKFARKLNHYQEPTYLFMSYRQRNGEYVYNDLKDLNKCLQDLLGIYRNPLSRSVSLDTDGNSFLAPGYSCKPESKD